MDPIPLVMMVAAVLLMVGGALLMASGDLGIAGALFLSASITIYIREKWV